jgi:hypothetical protein
MPNNKKGVKLSLGEFMGGAPTRELDALPTAPKVRGCVFDSLFYLDSQSWAMCMCIIFISLQYNSRLLTMLLSFSFRICCCLAHYLLLFVDPTTMVPFSAKQGVKIKTTTNPPDRKEMATGEEVVAAQVLPAAAAVAAALVVTAGATEEVAAALEVTAGATGEVAAALEATAAATEAVALEATAAATEEVALVATVEVVAAMVTEMETVAVALTEVVIVAAVALTEAVIVAAVALTEAVIVAAVALTEAVIAAAVALTEAVIAAWREVQVVLLQVTGLVSNSRDGLPLVLPLLLHRRKQPRRNRSRILLEERLR